MFTSMETLWERAVAFHGHACPGLAIGCRMVMEAARQLGLTAPAEDEELVCITETDACCVDAAQALLGCTLGKGNLFLKPRGKAAMSFYNRKTRTGCRVVWLGAEGPEMSREERMALILSPKGADYIMLQPLLDPALPEALLSPSIPCARCGERTAESMLRPHKGQLLCLDCYPEHSRILS